MSQLPVAELVEQGFIDKRARGGKQVYVPSGRVGAPDRERYRRQGEIRGRERRAGAPHARAGPATPRRASQGGLSGATHRP
ncbi:MAG: hypothetical protein IPK80_27925 [Nannocystis sp.]|nr:hypothetical protein [Nannocystis sp.]